MDRAELDAQLTELLTRDSIASDSTIEYLAILTRELADLPASPYAHYRRARKPFLVKEISRLTDELLASGNVNQRQRTPDAMRVHNQGDPVTASIAETQSVHTQRTVPLFELALEHKYWSNPREFTGLGADEIAGMGASVKAKGFVEPPKVKRILVGGAVVNLVIDGQRRILGARETLPKDFPVPVVDVDNDPPVELTPELADQLLLKALTTLERENLSSYELSSIASRMKDRGKTLEYIGKAILRDPSWVSKMLTARKNASPKLLTQWRKGEITDEQFKDLATIKEPEKQIEAAKEVVETRKSGDKAEARMRSKEIVENAKAGKKPAPAPAPERPPVVRGPQVDMFGQPVVEGPKAEAKDKPKPLRSRAVLDDFLHMFAKRPPTSDYVKGIADALRFVVGSIESDQLSKAWHQYASRVEGKPRSLPKKRRPTQHRTAKKSKPAKKSGKAKKK